jgi:flagellar biosynthetic protein FliR
VILEELPALAFGAVLVAARVGGAVMLLPGLGEPEVPPTVRLCLLLALVALLMPPLAPGLPALPEAMPELARLVATESLIGVFLGFLARVVVLALAQAGQMAALIIGLSSPLQTDAVFGGQATATGRLFGLLGAVLVFNTGLYALPLAALAESYSVLPPGEGLPLAEGAEAVAGAVSAWRRCSAPRSSACWPCRRWQRNGCAPSAWPCPPGRERTRSGRRASPCSGSA